MPAITPIPFAIGFASALQYFSFNAPKPVNEGELLILEFVFAEFVFKPVNEG